MPGRLFIARDGDGDLTLWRTTHRAWQPQPILRQHEVDPTVWHIVSDHVASLAAQVKE